MQLFGRPKREGLEDAGKDTKKEESKEVTSISGDYNVALQKCVKQEEEMDGVLRSVRSNYRFKASANSILIILGTILIGSPIVFSWLGVLGIDIEKDYTNLSYFLGGIGIVTFVATFYKKPQQNMAEAIGDLAQLFMICIMYKLQYRGVAASIISKQNVESCTIDDIQKANDQLYIITKKASDLVDEYLERYARGERTDLPLQKPSDKVVKEEGTDEGK